MRKLFFLALLLGCNWNLFGPPDGEPFAPMPVYRTWYAATEACSGLRGNYDALTFQTARTIRVGGHAYAGYWYPRHAITFKRDWVLLGRDGPRTELLAKHEFMHDLLQSGSHPAHYFNGVCGNLYPD